MKCKCFAPCRNVTCLWVLFSFLACPSECRKCYIPRSPIWKCCICVFCWPGPQSVERFLLFSSFPLPPYPLCWKQWYYLLVCFYLVPSCGNVTNVVFECCVFSCPAHQRVQWIVMFLFVSPPCRNVRNAVFFCLAPQSVLRSLLFLFVIFHKWPPPPCWNVRNAVFECCAPPSVEYCSAIPECLKTSGPLFVNWAK